jgi:hypothetical protein
MRGKDPVIWMIHTGTRLKPYLCCQEHEEILIARGGWNGTGERQSEHVSS